ncbi:hypothetical protein GGI20_005667, partial [Coemansia sp. BCRC 34301]
MREVATRSDDDSLVRQSQISIIRSVLGQQFVFPDEGAVDDSELCPLPTVTRDVYGTIYSTATSRITPINVVYQSAIQPVIPEPPPPISFTIVATTTTTTIASATATTLTTVSTTANATVTATTTALSTSTATIISNTASNTHINYYHYYHYMPDPIVGYYVD